MAKSPPPPKFVNPDTKASDPVKIEISRKKLRALAPELFNWFGLPTFGKFCGGSTGVTWAAFFREHLYCGDSRAAVVLQTSPLPLVAAYSDEFDYSVVLEFPAALAEEYRLAPGERLLTVNTYMPKTAEIPLAFDLVNGPKALHQWANFRPLIAEFLSYDYDEIDARKRGIAEAEWQRAAHFGREFLRSGKRPRLGGPFYAGIPRDKLTRKTFPPPARTFWTL